jgi:hypothetical protein
MKADSVIYFVVTFFFSLLLVSSAFEASSSLPLSLQAPIILLGIIAGMIFPAMLFVFIDEMIEKYDEWRDKE